MPVNNILPTEERSDDAVSAFSALVQKTAQEREMDAFLSTVRDAKAAAPAGGVDATAFDQRWGADQQGKPAGNAAPADKPAKSGSMASRFASDVIQGVTVEAAPQAWGGFMGALSEIEQLLTDTVGDLGTIQITDPASGEFDPKLLFGEDAAQRRKVEDDLFSALTPDAAETVTGGFIRSTSQFLTGFIPAAKALKAANVVKGAFAAEMAAGAIADAVVFDPYEDRLSTYLNEVPVLKEIVPDYLASNDEDQSHWEGRLKNAIEGAGLGLATEGLVRAFKYYRSQRAANGGAKPEPMNAADQAARDALRDDAESELVQEITDQSIAGLGDPEAPDLFVAAENDPTLSAALDRMGAARKRVEQDKAAEQVSALMERFRRDDLPDDVSPLYQALDLLRQGKTGAEGVAKTMRARPAADYIKGLGGIEPDSPLARELKSRDITPKTFPGLFKKGGVRALDNIPREEAPIFGTATGGVDVGNESLYVSPDEWVSALEAEFGGNPLRSQDELQALADADLVGSLDEELRALGIDWENMDNASIAAEMKRIADEADIRRISEGALPETAISAEFEAYRMEHRAPVESDYNANLSDMSPLFGDDIYSPNALADHGTGNDVIDKASLGVIKKMRGDPDGMVTVYRAVPLDVGDVQINKGDWVSINRQYADDHGAAYFDGHRVIETDVPARTLWNDGGSIHEWGYDGPEAARTLDDLKAEDRAIWESMTVEERAKKFPLIDPNSNAKQGKIFINHARIRAPEDVKALLQGVADMDAEGINAARGGEVVTNKQTITKANQEFRDLTDLIGRDPGPMTASQAVAARRILAASGEQLLNLADKAASDAATNADLFAFRRAMVVHYAIQAEVIAARTETARALQSWSIFTGSTKKARNIVCAI